MDGMHDHMGSYFSGPTPVAVTVSRQGAGNKFLMLTKCVVITNGPKAGN